MADGVNDVISCSHSTSLDFGPGTPFTIETWAYMSGSTGAHQYLLRKGQSTYWNLFYKEDSEVWRFLIRDDARTYINYYDAFPVGKWIYLVGMYDGIDQIEFFVDGVSRGTNTRSFTDFSSSNPLEISHSFSEFQGIIDLE